MVTHPNIAALGGTHHFLLAEVLVLFEATFAGCKVKELVLTLRDQLSRSCKHLEQLLQHRFHITLHGRCLHVQCSMSGSPQIARCGGSKYFINKQQYNTTHFIQ